VEVRVAPLTESLDRAIQPGVIGAELAGGLGVLALVLASIGMSGVFAYVVRQRSREIGIRMALGARPGDAVRLVLASNLRGLVVGMALGLAGAAGAAKLLAHQFTSVSALDPWRTRVSSCCWRWRQSRPVSLRRGGQREWIR
jgi:hypothetical protein